MRTLPTIAALAALTLGLLLATGANAQRVPKGGEPGPDLCTAACIALPTPPKTDLFAACSDKLADLPRVTQRQVRGIGPTHVVHLVPLCDIRNHTLTREETTYLSRGNVSGLIPAIAQNRVLMAALGGRGYDANDVIGVALGPDAAILYVSHR